MSEKEQRRVEEYTGLIIGYRRGTNTQYTNQVLARIHGIESHKQAAQLVGWKALYVDKYGNKYYGKIVGVHGRKGVVKIVFKPNLPGQAIGEEFRVFKK